MFIIKFFIKLWCEVWDEFWRLILKIGPVFIGLCFITQTADAKHLYKEKDYQALWCNKRGGIMEYQLSDKTRVDCLLPTLAVEFDFANKWAECIGQALYYGQKTNRTPACVLIMENPEKDKKYLRRLRYAVYNKKKIPAFRTFTVKPVFQYSENEYFK